MKKVLFIGLLSLSVSVFSQVGIGTKTPSDRAMLDVTATDKGLLPPRLTSAELLTLSSDLLTSNSADDIGMIAYNKDLERLVMWEGAGWVPLAIDNDSYTVRYLEDENVISATTIGVSIDGNISIGNSEKFAGAIGKNVLIYVGNRDKDFNVTASVSFKRNLTNETGIKDFEFYIVKNAGIAGEEVVLGSTVLASMSAENDLIYNVSIDTSVTLEPLHTIELYVKGDTQVLIKSMQFKAW